MTKRSTNKDFANVPMNLDCFKIAADFIEFSHRAKSLEALGKAFSAAGRQLGFDHYAYVSSVEFGSGALSASGSEPTDGFFLADIDRDQFSDWCAEDYLVSAPTRAAKVLEKSYPSEGSMAWYHGPIGRSATPKQMRLKEDTGCTIGQVGMSVPVHVSGGLPGLVNVIGSSETIDPAASHAVHLMSLHLHDAVLKLAKKEKLEMHPTIKLTPRERECMKWVVSGKTDWEISSILNISERTVHNHVESAKTKMGVKSRVQAVVRAFLGNLI